jgi:hypothetical protein
MNNENKKKETVKITLPARGRFDRPPNTEFTLWKHNFLNPLMRRRRAESKSAPVK